MTNEEEDNDESDSKAFIHYPTMGNRQNNNGSVAAVDSVMQNA